MIDSADTLAGDGAFGRGARVSYVFIETQDLARALAFYRDALGFEVVFSSPEACAFLRLGRGPQLAIYRGTGRRAGDHPILAVDVPSLDEALRALGDRGVTVSEPFAVPAGRAATFSDPDGNVLEVHEHLDPLP